MVLWFNQFVSQHILALLSRIVHIANLANNLWVANYTTSYCVKPTNPVVQPANIPHQIACNDVLMY